VLTSRFHNNHSKSNSNWFRLRYSYICQGTSTRRQRSDLWWWCYPTPSEGWRRDLSVFESSCNLLLPV